MNMDLDVYFFNNIYKLLKNLNQNMQHSQPLNGNRELAKDIVEFYKKYSIDTIIEYPARNGATTWFFDKLENIKVYSIDPTIENIIRIRERHKLNNTEVILGDERTLKQIIDRIKSNKIMLYVDDKIKTMINIEKIKVVICNKGDLTDEENANEIIVNLDNGKTYLIN